jgi:hypothetical protein
MFIVASESFPPVNAVNRHHVAYLALGERTPPLSFYQPFLPHETRPKEVAVSSELVVNKQICESLSSPKTFQNVDYTDRAK